MNIFDFLGGGEVITVTFEQYVGNQLVQTQQMQAPLPILQSQFMQAMNQMAQMKGRQALKIKMIQYFDIWSEFDKKMLRRENSISFQNWSDEE